MGPRTERVSRVEEGRIKGLTDARFAGPEERRKVLWLV